MASCGPVTPTFPSQSRKLTSAFHWGLRSTAQGWDGMGWDEMGWDTSVDAYIHGMQAVQ